ncbi:MAG: hypothetical protein RMJ48_08105 [Roseiflexaceae bacterium]|nr:hypothetical protein [Roseiflexaceae bacterium]
MGLDRLEQPIPQRPIQVRVLSHIVAGVAFPKTLEFAHVRFQAH